ncbi:MAG: hypothetical protein IJ087_03665 [Eggerthellaceae bacterium]|nr:hypothetical protein [Eggerthellaceae bacterium]
MNEHARHRGIYRIAVCMTLALVVAAVVQAAVLSGAAHAAGLQAGAQAVSAQGGTVKMKVVSGWGSKQGYFDSSAKVSYLSNGLIKQVDASVRQTDGGGYTSADKTKYTYSADKLTKTTFTDGGSGTKSVTSIKYDGKGRMKTVKGDYASSTYAYDGDGLVKTRKGYSDGKLMQTDAYAYNARGDLVKVKQSQENPAPKALTMSYKHTYKDGTIGKTKVTYKPSTYATLTLTYSYTTVEVPKSYVKAVKSQHRNLMQSQFRVFTASSIYPTQA